MRDGPPDGGRSGDGDGGWYAYEPLDPVRDWGPWEPPPDGAVIRLMGDHGATIPLWSYEDGLMFNEPEEVVAALGVSPELAADLADWANRWEGRSKDPELDADAVRLVRRLRQEVERYQFVYRP